ncbi:unnamed protein product [Dovyalis caffra]|uniref:Uncharacterized protein n=1 Tax=Dovyalis caffra TaxID=77055 RepID=A0AAV1RN86_9ROSI|nr:unnamed protein product [Dovyalis caffra]
MNSKSIELAARKWKRVEESWKVTQCPRSSLGVDKDEQLFNRVESESTMKVGACGVRLGERTFVSGSAYECGAQGFFVVDA